MLCAEKKSKRAAAGSGSEDLGTEEGASSSGDEAEEGRSGSGSEDGGEGPEELDGVTLEALAKLVNSSK